MNKYKICYCSLIIPDDDTLFKKLKGHISGISLSKFAKALISGIDENMKTPIKVFNIVNLLNFPSFPKIFFKTKTWSHKRNSDDYHIGYINIFFIKYITQYINLYIKLDKWIKDNSQDKIFLIVHDAYFPIMKAAIKIKQKYKSRVIICLISGDIPSKFGFKSQYGKSIKELIKEKLIKHLHTFNYKLVQYFDCYVFQTKYMGKAYNIKNKPIKILECTYVFPKYRLKQELKHFKIDHKKKIVFYAGSLRQEYGILHLLKAFELIKDKNYVLLIAGDGNGVSKILKYTKHDTRIQYIGFVSPKEIYAFQKISTVLVSPRTSKLRFSKYSFPSKTMDCLASGKPYIAHRLPCDPIEYSNYIIYPKDETDEELSRTIVSICELSLKERIRIGRNNIKFIKEKKNPKRMCKCIIDLADEMTNKL